MEKNSPPLPAKACAGQRYTTLNYGYSISGGYFEAVFFCWIFPGSHLKRVLHVFLLFILDFVRCLMVFLSMLMSRERARRVEKALFPLVE